MLTLGDVKCQYLVGLDMEEVGKKLMKCVAGAKSWSKGLPDWKMKDISMDIPIDTLSSLDQQLVDHRTSVDWLKTYESIEN